VLLVADGMTGQDAVKIARGFHEGVGLTGVILTKLDGDTRGGAALSIHGVTAVPIKYVGVGEKTEALEPFDPVRMAGRILGQGDVVALVEKAVANVDAEAAKRLEQKVKSKKGMDLQDFLVALKEVQSVGSAKQVLGLLPGINAKALKGLDGRQAPEARRGDRALDDAARARRPERVERQSQAADREGGRANGTGSESIAGTVPADAQAQQVHEKDVGHVWQLVFVCVAWGGRASRIFASWSRSPRRPAMGALSRQSATTIRGPNRR
jgi:hypothetical protein